MEFRPYGTEISVWKNFFFFFLCLRDGYLKNETQKKVFMNAILLYTYQNFFLVYLKHGTEKTIVLINISKCVHSIFSPI